MPVNLSVKNVPDVLAERLRERAKRHHRSLQGEMVAILESAVTGERLSLVQALQRARQLKIPIPGGSTRMIRTMRDGR